MGTIDVRLAALGLVLPSPVELPPGVRLPFEFVRVVGTRAVISGHGPLAPDGSIAPPLGKVGSDVTLDEAVHAAQLTALAILSSLQRAIGDLDRITAWTRLFGMVNAAPGFTALPAVINGASDLVIALFGPDVGAHSRSAIGVAELPFNIPVEIEGEVEIAT
jgi:YjgF/chorismate_mutase-like, putative endoribonuclease